MKKITIKQIMKFEPCYTEQELKTMARDLGIKRSISILDFANHKEINVEDKFWLLLRPEYIPEKELHLFACWCATRALKRERKAGREPDPRSWAAIKAKKDWLKGKITDDQLAAVWDAAWDAASAAAWAAAWDAAWYSAEQKAQLEQLIKIIKKVG